MARLALPLLVLNLTHSIAAVATLRVVQSIPYILFGAPAGALIDRVDKRQLSSPATSPRRDTAATPRSAIAGMFSSEPLYLIGFPLGTVEVLWGVTTDFSVIPSLVEERELADANAVFLAADRGARIVGPTLGGFAIAAVGGVNARSRRSRRYGNTRCASLLPML